MKKLGLYFMTIALTAMTLSFVGCTDDHNAPVIIIASGVDSIIINENTPLATTIPVDVSCDTDNLSVVAFYVVGADDVEYKVKEVLPGETQHYSTTITMADDLAAVMIALQVAKTAPAAFKVIATSVDGEIANAEKPFKIIQKDDDPTTIPLSDPTDFTWYRLANTQTGIAGFGLKFGNTAKAPFVTIEKAGATKFVTLTKSQWESLKTDEDLKAAVDAAADMDNYRKIDANASAYYDDVLAVIYNGEYKIMHVTHATIQPGGSGTAITITGKYKY